MVKRTVLTHGHPQQMNILSLAERGRSYHGQNLEKVAVSAVVGLSDTMSGILKAGHFAGQGLKTSPGVGHLLLLGLNLPLQFGTLLGQGLDLSLVLGVGGLGLLDGKASRHDLLVELGLLGFEGRQLTSSSLTLGGNLSDLLAELTDGSDL